MNFVDLLGLVAATFTTAAFIPQVAKTWRSKSAADLSLEMLIAFSIGLFLWMVYGIFIKSWPVILANAITLVLSSINLILKIKYES